MDLWFNKTCAKRFFFSSMLLMVLFVLAAYPFLPGRIISPAFNLMGSGANAPRLALLIFQLVFMALYTLMGYGTAEVLIRTMPDAANIPNKDYWLHPSRRDATVERVSAMGYWILVFTNALLWIIFIRITLEQTAGMAISGIFFPVVILLYLLALTGFLIGTGRAFKKQSSA